MVCWTFAASAAPALLAAAPTAPGVMRLVFWLVLSRFVQLGDRAEGFGMGVFFFDIIIIVGGIWRRLALATVTWAIAMFCAATFGFGFQGFPLFHRD
jgi:hypothetical protein